MVVATNSQPKLGYRVVATLFSIKKWRYEKVGLKV
jgi:hypothetical protein